MEHREPHKRSAKRQAPYPEKENQLTPSQIESPNPNTFNAPDAYPLQSAHDGRTLRQRGIAHSPRGALKQAGDADQVAAMDRNRQDPRTASRLASSAVQPVDEALPSSGEPSLSKSGEPRAQEVMGLRRKFFSISVPSWFISLLVHVALLLLLAAISLDPVERVRNILQASYSESTAALEQFDLQAPPLDASTALDEPLSTPSTNVSEVVEMQQFRPSLIPTFELPVDALESNRLTETILPTSVLSGAAMSQMAASFNARSSSNRSALLERFGGNAASEKAVAMALKWLADHQAPNGGWSFAHSAVCRGACDGQGDLALATNAATAMALLPFLGAGQTHLEGQYKETVHRGLAFLIMRIKVTSGQLPYGSWHEPGGRMYSHGLAAITLCEAYAMTRDPNLLQPAQLSLNYLIEAQDKRGGGWRYEPGQAGDTSVVGWCVMALKSGKMGNLVVPDSTFRRSNDFLDMVSTNQGAYYGYNRPTAAQEGRQATTAVGLLCRMYLGWPKDHPGLVEGIQFLDKFGPRKNDLYFTYYGTQVMRHYGGPTWEKWNGKLRDELIAMQEKQGHAAGSWTAEGRHAEKGGRLYATSLATMILEVYYRHMPLYSDKSSSDDFEI